MKNKNSKDAIESIDFIAEQWVKLILSQIETKKQKEAEIISDKN